MVGRMNTQTIARSRLFFGFSLVLGLLAYGACSAWPQASSDDILPADGRAAFSKAYLASPSATKLLSGKDSFDPKDKKQIDILDMEAKNAIYRFTWPEVQRGYEERAGKGDTIIRDTTHNVESQFQKLVASLGSLSNPKNPTSKMVAPVFTRLVIEHAMEVITQTRKPIGQINAARCLARLAEAPDKDPNETPQQVLVRLGVAEEGKPAVINDLAESYLKCLQKSPTDGVKYYALKGIIDLFKLSPPKGAELTPKNQTDIAAALDQFIMKPLQFPNGVADQELEGARSLRREAIRALAQLKLPEIGDQRPALVLLKVVANDGLSPEARSDERIEAAIGLTHMKIDPDKGYQPDYAMYYIAVYLGDLAKGIQTQTEKKHAWKIYAARMTDGLSGMSARAKNEYVTKTAEKCIKEILLRLEESGADVKNLPYDKFHDEIMASPPPAKSLFKGEDKATIKTGN